MKGREEIEEEISRLRRLREQMEKSFTPDVLKIGLMTMRIEALEWVLDAEDGEGVG